MDTEGARSDERKAYRSKILTVDCTFWLSLVFVVRCVRRCEAFCKRFASATFKPPSGIREFFRTKLQEHRPRIDHLMAG
jgi:hypothetical protein